MAGAVDLVIRGGQIFDGSGSDGFDGDVAVDGGRIVAVGKTDLRGREEIDARGRIVTPGFVDIHTHYDGQAIWSNRLDPSSANGVTTVVMGNCGVGFAPCRAADRDLLIRVMEGVEDIPELVMAEGLSWSWESFPEYLDALDSRPRDIDVAAYLPHSALRVFVMGERGARREAATPADLEKMGALAFEALRAGAIGFATSTVPAHRTRDGDPIPSFLAAEAELQTMAQAIARAGRGAFQMVANFEDDAADAPDKILSLFTRLSKTAGRPLSFTMNQSTRHPNRWRDVFARVTAANAAGGVTLRPQILPRPLGIIMGHRLSLNPFRLCPTYDSELAALPHAEKIARLHDPAMRARLLGETPAPAKQVLFGLARMFDKMFEVGDVMDYEPPVTQCITARAARAGVSPLELAYDLMLQKDGATMLFLTAANYANGNLDHILEMLGHDSAVLGLGDGGAHYGLICDASYPTSLLTHWTRDRAGSRLSLAAAVKALTSTPAAHVGFNDRGVLKPGAKADVNVIDYDKLTLLPPHISEDLPGKRGRLNQSARGYTATIVSGKIIARDDQPTGVLPGRLVRSA
jgi:N-acyl-D-aspartate/D-glutamate deacylase